MRNLIRHIRENPFIFAAGLAAFIHSVWTLDVMFAGPEVLLAADPLNAIFRKVVAGFIAISIDIGQIQTSIEIREGQKNRTKYVAFFSFAAATYFLQWVYMTHHIPVLEMGGGVRAEWLGAVRFILDCSVWIIPGLLPLSTLLYTFSQAADKTLVTLEGGITVLVDKDHAKALSGASANGGIGTGAAPVPAIPVRRGRPSNQTLAARNEGRDNRIGAGSSVSAQPPPYADSGENTDQGQTIGGNDPDALLEIDLQPDPHLELFKTVQMGLDPHAGVYQVGDTWSVKCPVCAWSKEGYVKVGHARSALRSHAPYCKDPQAEWWNVWKNSTMTANQTPADLLQDSV